MDLVNLQLIHTDQIINIRTLGGKIERVMQKTDSPNPFQEALIFEEAIVLPGLINSHDHLDFNLFPQLGNRQYQNYTEWATNIHGLYKEQINQVLRIPELVRAQWGIYKNLLSGFTTVVNHGKKLALPGSPITILQKAESLHSLAFEKRVKWRINNPFKINVPICMHVGEGIDEFALNEINTLIRYNFLRRDLIGVHAIGISEKQSKFFKGIVWCPSSNGFMFEQTANIAKIKNHTTVCFGSDSTLTSAWEIWSQINQVGKLNNMPRHDMLRTLTSNPAALWKLNGGYISENKDADIVVVKKTDTGHVYSIKSTDILFIMHKGAPLLFDESLLLQQTVKDMLKRDQFQSIRMGETTKYIRGDIRTLIKQTTKFLPNYDLPIKMAE